eukprot:11646432-Alexandrium_andersonii.AAC.1
MPLPIPKAAAGSGGSGEAVPASGGSERAGGSTGRESRRVWRSWPPSTDAMRNGGTTPHLCTELLTAAHARLRALPGGACVMLCMCSTSAGP